MVGIDEMSPLVYGSPMHSLFTTISSWSCINKTVLIFPQSLSYLGGISTSISLVSLKVSLKNGSFLKPSSGLVKILTKYSKRPHELRLGFGTSKLTN